MRRPWMLVAIAAACGPPLGAGEPSEPDQARARASIQRMLDHGFKPGPAGLKAAEESYRAVAHLASADPRIDYAWGLVLLRQFRHAQATERFQAATQCPGDPFCPAWRALIWCRLTAGQFDTGLEAVEALTDHLLTDDGDADAKRETALWLGRTLAALEITTEPPDRKDRIVALDLQIRDRFTPDLLRAYESGKPLTWQKQAELLREIDQLREQTVEKNAQTKEEKQQQVQAGLEKLAQQKQAVANAAGDWKGWFDEQTRRSDRQLIVLKKDTAYLQRRAASVQQSLLALGVEDTARRLVSGERPGTFPQGGVDLLKAQQIQQWLEYELELLATVDRMQRVSGQAAFAWSQRWAAVRRYRAGTDRLSRTNQMLITRSGHLLRRATELENQPLDRSPRLAARTLQMQKLSTYMALNLHAERLAVLKSLGAP